MAALFQYQPHVHRDGKVFTPDLLVAHARARIGETDLPLPIDRLSTATTIQQVDPAAHGMAALVVVGGGSGADQGPLLTIGSLHGAGGDLLSCAKPISRQAWRLSDVADHLDRIVLRGWHVRGNVRIAASEEALRIDRNALAAVGAESLRFYAGGGAAGSDGGVDGFHAELEDPVLGRRLPLAYAVTVLN